MLYFLLITKFGKSDYLESANHLTKCKQLLSRGLVNLRDFILLNLKQSCLFLEKQILETNEDYVKDTILYIQFQATNDFLKNLISGIYYQI